MYCIYVRLYYFFWSKILHKIYVVQAKVWSATQINGKFRIFSAFWSIPLAFRFLVCPFSWYFLLIFIFVLHSFTHSLSHSFTSFSVLCSLSLCIAYICMCCVLIPLARPKFYLVTLKSFKSINMRRTKHYQNDIYLNGEFHSHWYTLNGDDDGMSWKFTSPIRFCTVIQIITSPACSNPCAPRTSCAHRHIDTQTQTQAQVIESRVKCGKKWTKRNLKWNT